MVQSIHQAVLVASNDHATTRRVLEVLAARAIRGVVSRDAGAAAERLHERPWDLLIIDLGDAEGAALEVLRLAKQRYPEMPVVIAATDAPMTSVVRAMREGCHDVAAKPLTREAVEALISTLLPSHDVPLADAAETDGRCLYQIAGRSPRLFETVALAKKAAPSSMPVLITGESGTGKELISYLIHHASRRARGPYIRVNCAALSESLLESELFGHERGAFTGAVAQRKGRFELAHGGTLLLDEVSETGPRLQAELLRVLEQQDFERVGGTESVSVNVRVISTTNRDLAHEVQRGAFRADLYYRLCGVRISVPPLRGRREDIPVLVWHFINQFAREVHRGIKQVDPETMDLLLNYDWPGNVRQLRNVVRNALVLGDGPVLSLVSAPWLMSELRAAPPPRPGAPARTLCLREIERLTILEAMRLTRSHQTKAARLLGITDRTLREKLRRYRQEEQPAEAPSLFTGGPAGLPEPEESSAWSDSGALEMTAVGDK